MSQGSDLSVSARGWPLLARYLPPSAAFASAGKWTLGQRLSSSCSHWPPALHGPAGAVSRSPRQVQRHLAHYSDTHLSFDYPSSWKVSHYDDWVSPHEAKLVYLSTEPTHDPCVRSGNTITCGDPISSLRSGGVLVAWAELGFPGWNLNWEKGSPLQIDRLPAKLDVLQLPAADPRVQGCIQMGGDESVLAWVARRAQSNAYALSACLRSPNVGRAESEVKALLESTRFTELHCEPEPACLTLPKGFLWEGAFSQLSRTRPR